VVRRLLSVSRLVSLTGVGGVGKSRLALRVASDVRRAFAGGVWLAELDELEDPVLLPEAISRALGIADEPARDQLEVLSSFLADRRLLLVIDNCEHLLPECAVLITSLLRSAPGLRVLATSRVTLGIPGELIYDVSPLLVPERGEEVWPDATVRYPALALFADRAAASSPGFAVDAGNVAAVAQVCRQLDGLPLAIELAAAWVRSLSVEQVASRLDDRFRLLTGGGLGVPPRHRTLLAAMEWSYQLCSKEERSVWARASVFAGRFDLAAVERVCAGDGLAADAVLAALASLVDQSVVIAEEDPSGMRYHMLDTVRAYGLTRLREPDDDPSHAVCETVLRRRHCAHFTNLAEAFDADWFGPRQVQWSRRMRAELPQLRAALQYSLASPDQPLAGLRLAGALQYFWRCCGEVREGRLWLERALAAEQGPSWERARALAIYSRLVMAQGFGAQAAEAARECLDLARQFDDGLLLVNALRARGLSLVLGGDRAAGLVLLDEAVGTAAALPDIPLAAAFATYYRAMAAAEDRDDVRVLELLAESGSISRAHGDQWLLGECLLHAVPAALMLGDIPRVAELASEAVPLHRALNNTLALTMVLEYLAWAAAVAGDNRRAARLLGAADRHVRALGGTPYGSGRHFRDHQDCTESARAALGDAQFTTEFQAGGELTLDGALNYALDGNREAGQAPAHPAPPATGHPVLTRRQTQVAALVAQGMSNKQIAAELDISGRTAETHVENILVKLGFTSRSQIAAWHATRAIEGDGT
jgi:predicted ATPase/DNA-binding CsgD family transcriptional regulator